MRRLPATERDARRSRAGPGSRHGRLHRHLLEHLVHALAEPLMAARLGGLGQARPYDEDVVIVGANASGVEPRAPDLAQLALDPVANDGVARSLGNREPETGLPGLALAREPVKG